MALDPDGAASSAGNNLLLGVASMGGTAAFKLLRMLSGKFRKACRANSFTGDTPVSTSDGLKRISDIVIGDLVWAYDEKTGENVLQEVIHLVRGVGLKALVDIKLESGDVITATVGHPMYSAIKQGWVDAGELKLSDVMLQVEGNEVRIVNPSVA